MTTETVGREEPASLLEALLRLREVTRERDAARRERDAAASAIRSADGVLDLLRENPELAVEVAQGLHVAGPWTRTAEDTYERRQVLADGTGKALTRVFPALHEDGWRYEVEGYGDDGLPVFRHAGDAQHVADGALAEDGWVLAPAVRS